jgi:formylglycine-generating enzyme required for sulfatase activity
MQRTFLFFIAVFFSINLSAQIAVKSFRVLQSDQTARITDPVIDQNGEKCALIKVVATTQGLLFEGGMLGVMKREWKNGEYWVYIPHGAKKITIKHDDLGVLRNYIYPEAISEATVYEMVLTTGKVITTVVQQEIFSEWVIITSEPKGADVYIDDRNLGQTPFQQELKEGKHTFRISKDLYHTEAGAFELSVEEGKKQLDYALKPNYGYIKVSSQPESGATVFIDGKEQNGKTPFTSNKLKSGEHDVSVSKQMFGDYQTNVTVSDNQTVLVNADLSARFGNLSLSSLPENGAEVTIDGQPSGKTTPCTIEKLASGDHIVTLRQAWYETKKVQLSISDGENKSETLTLMPTFAEVQVKSDPLSDIYIDNTKVGRGTYSGRVVAGLHTFEARKEKHQSDSKKLELLRGTNKEISLLPSPIYGTLKIQSTPFNAAYSVKPIGSSNTAENLSGTTPNTLRNLLVGEYDVQISSAGYASHTQSIWIKEAETVSINAELASAKQLTINSNPQGAKLYIDDEYKGTTPFTVELAFGKHNVKFTKAEHKDLSQSIEIKTYTTDISLTLESIIKEIPGMVFVKGGTFQMGSNDGESDEKPVHSVTVSDFYIGKYEVTQKQWKEIMGASTSLSNPSKFKGDNLPVEQVSWNDVQEFIVKLNQKTGKKYRLPTEAEWEYAARGASTGSATKYAGSNNIDNVAWYSSNSGSKTHAVGTKRANELGIYDMTGNVWEWCSDWFGAYKRGSQNNPKGAVSGSRRVYRGGGWRSGAGGCRGANRADYSPGNSYNNLGFRLALVP